MADKWSPWEVPGFLVGWDRGNPGGFETSENGPYNDNTGIHDSTRLVTVHRRWDGQWTVGADTRPVGARQWGGGMARVHYGPFPTKERAKEFAEEHRNKATFFNGTALKSHQLSVADIWREREESSRIEMRTAREGYIHRYEPESTSLRRE